MKVDEVLDCERSVARKAGGRGFRYLCNVSWTHNDREYTQNSVIWFDDFLDEWFVEVLKSRAPVDWESATQITELDDSLWGVSKHLISSRRVHVSRPPCPEQTDA